MRQIDKDLLDASKDGDLNKVKQAIENGADVNAKDDEYGWTPLHYASVNGHEAVISLLLTNDANINAKTNGGRTPLHYASRNGLEAIVSILLEYGANVNAKMNDGWTPLHEAIRYSGKVAITLLLLENGADLTITDNIAKKKRFQSECLEKFKTRAALDQELQRLQQLIDAAKDSVDSDINSAVVTAEAEYEMILPLLKWPQYLSVPELESKIAKLEEQAQGMDIGKERMEVLLKRNELKQYLEQEIEEGMLEQISEQEQLKRPQVELELE